MEKKNSEGSSFIYALKGRKIDDFDQNLFLKLL